MSNFQETIVPKVLSGVPEKHSKAELDDLFSHESAWLDALQFARNKTPCKDDRAYWEKEIKVFERTWQRLNELKAEILALNNK